MRSGARNALGRAADCELWMAYIFRRPRRCEPVVAHPVVRLDAARNTSHRQAQIRRRAAHHVNSSAAGGVVYGHWAFLPELLLVCSTHLAAAVPGAVATFSE